MDVHVFNTAADVAHAVVLRLQDALTATPSPVLGLAAGQTPIPIYSALRRMVAANAIDFSQASTFNLDEFVGIPPSHPGSFRRFMDDQLFTGINLEPRHIHFLDGTAADLDQECQRYEDAIRDAGGIGCQLLGIGRNGHIGFNEPGDAVVARTHVVTLLPETREANATLFDGDIARVPKQAVTMGVGTILRATTIVLIATGAAKASAVEAALTGPVSPQLPASFLQLHDHVGVYLDRLAAARLRP